MPVQSAQHSFALASAWLWAAENQFRSNKSSVHTHGRVGAVDRKDLSILLSEMLRR